SIPPSTVAMPALARAPDCSRRRTIPGIAAPAARRPRLPPAPRRARRSWERGAGGEAAAHRARASTRGTQEDVAKRDAAREGFEEAPQANYGTAATIPMLDPELARQLGLPTAEDDDEALARPPRRQLGGVARKAH